MRRAKNYKILRNILSKSRQIDFSQDVSYLIIYSFLYKYASDILKDYFRSVIEKKALTLDEAYGSEEFREIFRNDALQMFGYYITGPDYFMDEVINNSYSNRFFIYDFFEAFSQNIEFKSNSNYEKYFSFIFDAVKSEINLKKFEFEGENHLIVKEIIYSISKLDILDNQFPFERVFDHICQSRMIRINSDPDYLNQMLIELVTRSSKNISDVYNPFLNDGSSLVSLKRYCERGIENFHAKGFDKITYCASIVKFLINYFNFDNLYLEFSSPLESQDVPSTSFDVIMAKIPPITSKNMRKLNNAQNIEMAKRNKRKQLENILSDKFDMKMDSFMDDEELNSAIDNLLSKMDLENASPVQFQGEYESLKDSEYMFLINLINCLKDGGMMAVAMSQSFLFKNSLELLRKYLTVEKNYIDAIISIPDELSRPKSSEIIVVFRKNKSCDDIVFIDMSKMYATIPVPDAVPGLFKRNILLSPETLGDVVDAYAKRLVVDKFSNVINVHELAKNEFNLSISRYVDTFEGEFISLGDLKYQKREIDENLDKLNKKIDVMLSDLNIRF